MTTTGDAHLILHHTRARELAGEAAKARLARSVPRDRSSFGATVLRFLERRTEPRETPIPTARVAP